MHLTINFLKGLFEETSNFFKGLFKEITNFFEQTPANEQRIIRKKFRHLYKIIDEWSMRPAEVHSENLATLHNYKYSFM